MNNKKVILSSLYKSNKNYLYDYFNELNIINIIYCKFLKKNKTYNQIEYLKIKKACLDLKKKKFKPLFKKFFNRGYYFEYERYLTKKIGPHLSGKMHTGRSRNDLEATIYKVLLKKKLIANLKDQTNLLQKLINKFSNDKQLLPFYTQHQFSTFITVNHYFNSNILAFFNYLDKIIDFKDFINECPLGSSGLSGSSINIDYKELSKNLKFKSNLSNSHRLISEYEFYLSYINDLNLIVLKWSRILQDITILHNENNKIVSFKKEFYGRSSYFPHKQNIYLIEYAQNLCSKLINYSTYFFEGIKKTVNSNSFDAKLIIRDNYFYFNEYKELINVIEYIIQNIRFCKIDILDQKFDKLFLTYLQNYIISLNSKKNMRQLNNSLFELSSSGKNFSEIYNLYKKEFEIKIGKNINEVKLFLIKSNRFGKGPNDVSLINKNHLILNLNKLKKKIKKF